MDNRDCCNIDCHYYVKKNKYRCGKCNGKRDYRCAICDTDLMESKKLFCAHCLSIRYYERTRKSLWNEYYCDQCGKLLTGKRRKRCSKECQKKYLKSLHYKICPMCFTPKKSGHALCEGDCKRIYLRLIQQMCRGGLKDRMTMKRFVKESLKENPNQSNEDLIEKLMKSNLSKTNYPRRNYSRVLRQLGM